MRFRPRSVRKAIDVGFKDERGRGCTIDIEVPESTTKTSIFQTMGIILNGKGFSKSDAPASFMSLAWLPVATMVVAFLLGGLVAMSQATGGFDPSDIDSHGGGRSARRGRGFAVLLVRITSLIGFWRCLILTLGILIGCLIYLKRKLKNRPIVTTFSPS